MSRILWDSVGSRRYETGVSRGVLYMEDQPGVAWAGLISVSDKLAGAEVSSYYEDGSKKDIFVAVEETSKTVKCLSYPKTFSECVGIKHARGGLYLDNQETKPFSFSYQTLVANDIQGEGVSYKIHLVYNAYLAIEERTYLTNGASFSPTPYDLSVTTIPEKIEGRRATSSIVIDSAKTDSEVLKILNDILYGSETSEPRMPTVEEVTKLLSSASYQLRTNAPLGYHMLSNENMQREGSFENGTSMLATRGTLTRVARSDAVDGNYVGRYKALDISGAKYLQSSHLEILKAIPGVTYSVSYSFWGVTPKNNRLMRLDSVWYDGNTHKTTIVSPDTPKVEQLWKKHTYDFVAPEGVTGFYIRMVLLGEPVLPGEEVDFDAVKVQASIGPERDIMGDKSLGLFDITSDTRLQETSSGLYKIG